MKKLLFALTLVAGIFVIVQITALYYNIKKDITDAFDNSICIDLYNRANSSKEYMQVITIATDSLKKETAQKETAGENSSAKYETGSSREKILLRKEFTLQTGLKDLVPIDCYTLNKIFNETLKEKGIHATTAVSYHDKVTGNQKHSTQLRFTIHSDLIPLGLQKEIEVQAFVKLSLMWLYPLVPLSLKITFTLLGIFLIISLGCFINMKRKEKFPKQDNEKTNSILEAEIVTEKRSHTTESKEEVVYPKIKKNILQERLIQLGIPAFSEKKIRKLSNECYQIGYLLFISDKRTIISENSEKQLYPIQYNLLNAFLNAPNYTLSRKEVAFLSSCNLDFPTGLMWLFLVYVLI